MACSSISIYRKGINQVSVYERHNQKSRLDLLKNCFFINEFKNLWINGLYLILERASRVKSFMSKANSFFVVAFACAFFSIKIESGMRKKIAP